MSSGQIFVILALKPPCWMLMSMFNGWIRITLSGLCNPKCVNYPVESQQMGWGNDVSGLHNPECIKTVRKMKTEPHQHRGRSHLFWLSLCLRATTITIYDFD